MVGDGDAVEHGVEDPKPEMVADGQDDPVELVDEDTETLRVTVLEDVSDAEAETDRVTIMVGDGEAVEHGVGDPKPEKVADAQTDPVPLVDEVADTLRVVALEGESEDEVETERDALLERHIDAVPHKVGEPDTDTVADGQTVTETLEVEDTDALRVAALDGDSDDEVETDHVALLVGDEEAVKHKVGDPVPETVADILNDPETLEVGDTDALRVAALDGDSDDEVETDRVALLVGDEEAVKHRVGEPDTDDDVEAQTVRVLLADGEPVPLRDFAPVKDADTDVEGDKEPLVLGVADDVRHPEGDTVEVSDEELQ